MKSKLMYLIITCIALMAIILFIPSEVSAGYEYIDGIKYCIHDVEGDKFATVDGFKDDELPADGVVIIPEILIVDSIDYPVTQIRMQSFKDCIKLTSITIPKTVNLIENYAFERCSALEELIIPVDSTLNSIGNGSFKDCEKLTSITLPRTVTSIGDYAFERCRALEELIIPADSTLNSLGNGSIKDCEKLTSITLPKSLISIGEYAFERDYSLKTVNFPEDSLLTLINRAAFLDCTALKSISIPKSVTSIGDCVFERCSSLESVTIPEDTLLDTIGTGAFRDCTALEDITIPKTVTSIGASVFYNCAFARLEYISDFTNVSNNDYNYLEYSNGNFTVELIATEGNRLIQENISIIVGGNKLDNSSYSYNEEDGILTIPQFQITGNIEITAIAKTPYRVTINPVENTTITPDSFEDVVEGADIEIEIKANQGYVLTSVQVNGFEQELPLENDILSIKDIKEDIDIIIEVEEEKIIESEGTEGGAGIALRKIKFLGDSEKQKFFKENDKTLLFILDSDRGNGKVFVDGVELSEKDYTWEFVEGIYPAITLSEEYMQTLTFGEYTIRFEVENIGEAETTFIVIEAFEAIDKDVINNDLESPKTGDNILVIGSIALIALIIGITAVIIYKKQNKKD